MENVTIKHSPSPNVIVPHFLFGTLCWTVVSLLIVLRPTAFTQHYFNNGLLSITHLLVLGWLSMIIFGALYQLLPVIIEEALFSEKLAKVSFVLLGTGAAGIGIGFWHGWIGTLVTGSGVLVMLAVLLFVLNVFLTGYKLVLKTTEHLFIRIAVIWLLLTVTAGLLSAINLIHPFLKVSHLNLLKIHAHAGMVGWFLLLVMGVASKLFPMFLVSEKPKTKALKFSFALVNLGLITGLIATYWQWSVIINIAAITGTAGIVFYLYFIFSVFKNRKRKELDIGMKQSVVAFLFLAVAIGIMSFLYKLGNTNVSGTTLAIAFGATVLIGFFTTLTIGQTYKTLPFIIWLNRYQDKVGKQETPLPKDLYSSSIAHIQMVLFAVGYLFLMWAILRQDPTWVRAGGIVVLASSCLYGMNVFKIILHRPKSEKKEIHVEKEEKLFYLLKKVIDPELMINIVDLGLVYSTGFDEDREKIDLKMTLSSQACPLGNAIMENVHQVLKAGYPNYEIDIQLVWEPAWNSQMISEEGFSALSN